MPYFFVFCGSTKYNISLVVSLIYLLFTYFFIMSSDLKWVCVLCLCFVIGMLPFIFGILFQLFPSVFYSFFCVIVVCCSTYCTFWLVLPRMSSPGIVSSLSGFLLHAIVVILPFILLMACFISIYFFIFTFVFGIPFNSLMELLFTIAIILLNVLGFFILLSQK